MVNEHITSLGYRLEFTDDRSSVEALLAACRMEPMEEPTADGWDPSQYLLACTRAGGIAACIGWSRSGDSVVLHSLAVAPPTRGTGIGAGLLATAMGDIMDRRAVPGFYLNTDSGTAARLFRSSGFAPVETTEVPDQVREHPSYAMAGPKTRSMARTYSGIRRGLDNTAFRLILNDTKDATTPLGSVFFFRQNGGVIEASYRGGPVSRGHIIGAIQDDELHFLWHHFVEDGRLMSGDGHIFVERLPDGRRELRETLSSATSSKTNELILREV